MRPFLGVYGYGDIEFVATLDVVAQDRSSFRETMMEGTRRALLSSVIRVNEPGREDYGARKTRQPVIWFEVEDFLRYFDHFRNPTGIQRVSFEIYRAAKTLYGRSERVRFCRLSVYSKRLHPVGFDAIRSGYLNPPGGSAPWRTFWEPAKFWEEFPRSIPMIMRHPRFFFSIFKVAARDLIGTWLRQNRFERFLRRGDMIVSLGAGWGIPDHMKYIAEVKRRYGIKFSIFIHDVIPIKHQSFVEPHHAFQFRNWLQDAIPVADIVLTNSKYSRAALIELAAESGWRLPRVEIVEPGSGFGDRLTAGDQTTTSRFPARYVLFVSTIEIRKNHRLLVRVWQRLLERHGADLVPTLIFAGQIGWLIDGLLQDLQASEYLNGKIMLTRRLSDAELQQAYRSCLFTVFPSLCEGWGLPIAESLAHGKFCVASNRTSIPEVGGNLVDYFDPSDEDDALAKIERPLIDPGYLAAREAQLRAEYRPRTWADCVHALIGTLHQTVPQDSEAGAVSPAEPAGRSLQPQASS
jgi:glycosyltransferase involved in cell wall biosynthesis